MRCSPPADGGRRAQALGCPKARVTARVKLLELPQRARCRPSTSCARCSGDVPSSTPYTGRRLGLLSPRVVVFPTSSSRSSFPSC